MIRDWAYSVALLHPFSVWLGLWRGDYWIYATIILGTFIYPAVEILTKPVPPMITTTRSRVPKLLSWVTAMAVIFTVIIMMITITQEKFTILETIIIVYSCGLTTGIAGIVLAHEMLHQRSAKNKLLGTALIHLTSYPHFKLQHLYGHHPNVATDDDYSSAQHGQSLYNFLFRSIVLGGLSTLKRECTRSLKLSNRKFHPRHNRLISLWLIQFIIYILILSLLTPLAVAAFIAQGVIAIFVLETVNYIQHYGLNRSKHSRHPDYSCSWDNYSVTNYALFNLGHHSDHHVHPAKPFYTLNQHNDAPRIPYGYFTLSLIAVLPTFWHSLMNNHVLLQTTKKYS